MTTILYLAHLNPLTNAHIEIIKQLKEEAEIVKVMPVIFKLEYTDGTTEEIRLPAEIWKMQNEQLQETVSKVLITNKEVVSIVLDPNLETADTDTSNNVWNR